MTQRSLVAVSEVASEEGWRQEPGWRGRRRAGGKKAGWHVVSHLWGVSQGRERTAAALSLQAPAHSCPWTLSPAALLTPPTPRAQVSLPSLSCHLLDRILLLLSPHFPDPRSAGGGGESRFYSWRPAGGFVNSTEFSIPGGEFSSNLLQITFLEPCLPPGSQWTRGRGAGEQRTLCSQSWASCALHFFSCNVLFFIMITSYF